MNRWIRGAGAAALIALALLVVPGADRALAAADPPSVSLDSPVADTLQQAPFAITGSAHQGGTGSEPTVTTIKVKLSDDDGWLPPVEQNYAAGGSSNSPIFAGGGADVSFNWTNIAPKYNGPYTVTVTATGSYHTSLGGTQNSGPSTVSHSFHVEIKPSKPTGVTADKSEDSSLVTIKWKANPESDIAGYAVLRSYAGDAGKQIAAVDGTKLTYTDDLAGKAPGQYKYAIVAVRHARTCTSTTSGDDACTRPVPGDASTYSSAVTVRGAPAPTTTTTTTKKGGGGGGGGTTTTTSPGASTGSKGGNSTPRGGSGGGYAPGGSVDLSKFGDLLNPKGGAHSTHTTEPDGTYDGALPYGERAVKPSKPDNTLITIGGTSVPRPSTDWLKFIGAGLWMTAVGVHVLWFKQQVDRLPLDTIVD